MVNNAPQSDGVYLGFWGYGILVFSSVILIPNLIICVISYSYSILNLFFLIFSVGTFVLSFFVISFMTTNDHYGIFSK